MKKEGQIWQECLHCGAEPSYLPLELCESCWPRVQRFPPEWDKKEINDYYMDHPNLLLSELSSMTCRSVKELKRILMGEGDEK